MKARLLLVLLLFLFACWKGENFFSESHSLDERESIWYWPWFYQGNEELFGLSHSEGPRRKRTYTNDFNGGNNLSTPAWTWTRVLLSHGSDIRDFSSVIFYLSKTKNTTLYVVYVWGDRCGREVPHFDSRPVSISDPRVGMTPLGLFGPEPDGTYNPCL